jgi:prepilin-type N-terminal cleavage/methylation domain-containing protein
MQPTNNQQLKTDRAFTLIELLVVIAIVGILAGLAVVSMSGATEEAKIAKSKVFANSVNNSLLANRISEWRLDEGVGTTTADTVGTSNGIFVSSPAWRFGADCVSGGCLQFDGNDDRVNFSDLTLPSGNANRTVSIWAKPKSIPGTAVFFSYGKAAASNSFGVGIIGGKYYTSQHGSSVVGTTAQLDVWTNLVVTYDGSTYRLYQNGARTNSGSMVTNTLLEAGTIGTYLNYGAYYNGLIDDIRLYGEALTASAIREQYVAGLDNFLANNQITNEEYQQRIADLNSTYAANE